MAWHGVAGTAAVHIGYSANTSCIYCSGLMMYSSPVESIRLIILLIHLIQQPCTRTSPAFRPYRPCPLGIPSRVVGREWSFPSSPDRGKRVSRL